MASKLRTLTEDWGYESALDLMTDYMHEGLYPAICMNKGCNYSTEMEPDQDRGWCENCNTNSLSSAAILMGII